MLERLAAFELECKGKNLRPKTIEFYRWQLAKFFEWIKARSIERVEDIG